MNRSYEVIKEAAIDYKYLLNRGYNQKASLDLVTGRYSLSKEERALLLRCVHRDDEAEKVRSLMVNSIEGEPVIIDGYNIILTLVSVLEGREVYECDDGFIRDLRSSSIKDFSTPLIHQAINILADEITKLRPKQISVVLDKNVSWSAQHRLTILNKINKARVILAKKADISVIHAEAIVCSSDFLVLTSSKKVFDLAGYIIKHLYPQSIKLSFKEIFYKE
jgi:hypothetical protein